jgi:glycosyltransferase involved in cell wall biosynthesis
VINVLHLRDTDRVCGPGKTIIETACAATPGFTHFVGLFLLNRQTTNRYYDAAVRRGVAVLPIRSAHQFDPRIVLTILEIVKRYRIDIIHSHEYKSDLLAWAVARLRHIPVMTTIHGWIRQDLKRKLLYIKAGQSVLPWFERVVAVSHETKAAVISCGVPEQKVVVIHNGIVPESYRPHDHARGFLRRQFGIPDSAALVGYVGRLSPEKGQADLLEAAARLLPGRPAVWIVFVGEGPDRQRLERHAKSLGIADRVVYTGHIEDVRPVFRDLDILALTSHTEGLPNVVLEALCMETAVLANDVGGVSEIIEDGVTGLLLPPRSPTRIADGLGRLLDDPQWARSLALNGKRVVCERFTFQGRVAKEEALCRQILASWIH